MNDWVIKNCDSFNTKLGNCEISKFYNKLYIFQGTIRDEKAKGNNCPYCKDYEVKV